MRVGLILALFFSLQLVSQTPMDSGYKMLESKEYDKASVFFENIIANEPENKTAHICYARAVGLNGDPQKAIVRLNDVLAIYPDDVEINLNIAEAHLWNDDPSASLPVYNAILEVDSSNFTANFGKANTLSQLKKYDEALIYIDKADSLKENNPDVLNSKRFILYGVADKRKNEKKYNQSLRVLNNILLKKPHDEQALMNKGICYLIMEDYKNAERIFNNLIKFDLNTFDSNLLLSHIQILKRKNKDAIAFAETARKITENKTSKNYLKASLQKANALGAAKKFTQAHKLIDSLKNQFNETSEIKLTEARISVWQQDFTNASAIYDNLDQTSYDYYMGKTELYRAQKNNVKAIVELDQALNLLPQSVDAQKLKKELQLAQRTKIQILGSQSEDKGGNSAQNITFNVEAPIKEKSTFLIKSKYRETNFDVNELDAFQYSVLFGNRYQIKHNFSLNLSGGFLGYNEEVGLQNSNLIFGLGLNYAPSKNHSFGVSYSRDALNYSSDILRSGIFAKKLTFNYQFSKHNWPGLYLQAEQQNQNDDNIQQVIFASLFYQISAFPFIKLGTNFSLVSFDFSNAMLYFSPDSYKAGDVFLQFGNDFNLQSKLIYHFEASIGQQQIENDPWVETNRFLARLGYRLSQRLNISAEYFYNSAANTTNKGFSFTEYRLKLNWIL